VDFNIEKFLKRYVWDDEKTPYFTASSKLNRKQAHFECLAYSVFVGMLFSAIALITLTGAGAHDKALGPALFSFTMICAAVIFGFTKSYLFALWLSTAPIATVAYFLVYGFRPSWAAIDQIVIMGFVGCWIAYSVRIVAIGRRYDDMPEPPPKRQS
jgi:hypothetical protein